MAFFVWLSFLLLVYLWIGISKRRRVKKMIIAVLVILAIGWFSLLLYLSDWYN